VFCRRAGEIAWIIIYEFSYYLWEIETNYYKTRHLTMRGGPWGLDPSRNFLKLHTKKFHYVLTTNFVLSPPPKKKKNPGHVPD